MKIPTVALVGKPNVGKSTLFNRLAGKRISIIEDTPGVTRDRIYSLCEYMDYKFHLIDTGGIDLGNEDFNKEIRVQAELAIDEADVIIFIVDGKEELGANDYLIRDILKKSGKKVIVAINKMDSKNAKDNVYNFYSLGFDHYIPISAEANNGIYNLIYQPNNNASCLIKVQCISTNTIKNIVSLDRAFNHSMDVSVEQWVFHYDVDSNKITYLKDEHGNEGSFDFRMAHQIYAPNSSFINNKLYFEPENANIKFEEDGKFEGNEIYNSFNITFTGNANP